MEQPVPNSTITSVPATTTSVLLSSPGWMRPWVGIYNNSLTADLYIALFPTSSPTAFTCKLAPQGYYEVPLKYTGPVSGVWSAADGSALVTELTY